MIVIYGVFLFHFSLGKQRGKKFKQYYTTG